MEARLTVMMVLSGEVQETARKEIQGGVFEGNLRMKII